MHPAEWCINTAVEAFRTWPVDAGPYPFMAADAPVLKVREAGRVVNVHAQIATGVNSEGYREILSIDATLPGTAWQCCRTHYATSLMAITPKTS